VIYLSGAIFAGLRARAAAASASGIGLGVMVTPQQGYPAAHLEGFPFGCDTGCFSNPGAFSLEAYLDWLRAREAHRERCLFATAPDVLGDAGATLARSLPVLPRLRDLGYPAALVAQDGLEDLDVPWEAFDCLFVGGTTAWKNSGAADALAREARRRGKHTHLGRVNTRRRLRAAVLGGYHSADGTYLKYGPDKNLPQLLGWLEALQAAPLLPLWSAYPDAPAREESTMVALPTVTTTPTKPAPVFRQAILPGFEHLTPAPPPVSATGGDRARPKRRQLRDVYPEGVRHHPHAHGVEPEGHLVLAGNQLPGEEE